jgi:hypothetical protein
MSIEHKNIPDGQRHEPRGVSTATEGTAYIADGSGSGSWKVPQVEGQSSSEEGQLLKADGAGGYSWVNSVTGWGYYKHNGTGQVFNTTPSKLVVDGLEGTSEDSYLPYVIRGVDTLWDSSTNKLKPINIGDSYLVRIDLPVTSETGSPTEATLSLDIGGSASPTTVINTHYHPTGKSTPYTMTFSLDIFTLGTFLTNGGQVFINTDSGSITVDKPAIKVTRTASGSF